MRELYPLTAEHMRAGLPGLVDMLELDNIGHWIQHEAAETVSRQLVEILRMVRD